jgi:hypothetical protein
VRIVTEETTFAAALARGSREQALAYNSPVPG